jgi:curved DNA-binding protein CbpA
MTMYLLLGVQESATEHQIRAAYRTLARRYHPDVSRTPDAKKFARIHQAYNVLGNTINRMEYDQWLRDSREAETKALVLVPKETPPHSNSETPSPTANPHKGQAHPSEKTAPNIGRKGSRICDWFTGAEPESRYVVWG